MSQIACKCPTCGGYTKKCEACGVTFTASDASIWSFWVDDDDDGEQWTVCLECHKKMRQAIQSIKRVC